MPFTQELKVTQALILISHETLGCDIDRVQVNIPLSEQCNITAIDMVKFTLSIESQLGCTFEPDALNKKMSLNEISSFLTTKITRTPKHDCLADHLVA